MDCHAVSAPDSAINVTTKTPAKSSARPYP